MEEFKLRRERLLSALQSEFGFSSDSCIVLFSSYEFPSSQYIQDTSFWYYSGCEKAGSVIVIRSDGFTSLYIPAMSETSAVWTLDAIEPTVESARRLGLNNILPLGEPIDAHSMSPFWPQGYVHTLLNDLQKIVTSGGKLYTLDQKNGSHNLFSRMYLNRLVSFQPSLKSAVIDISQVVADQRRCKSGYEIDLLQKAVDVTALAHQEVFAAILDGATEFEIKAEAEYVMARNGMSPAFESIVASGENSVILHNKASSRRMKKGDFVVVDIGARYSGYCADISRTYVVGGVMNAYQQKIYNIVLDCQEYIAQIARPGFYLKNAACPEASLHHLALDFFKKYQLSEYFPHSIGHYLGLDVHDVGDYKKPLRQGDVITIEPGLYIPSMNCGIRIEDNYVLTASGSKCLSGDLYKDIVGI